ncbi:MAG: polyprenyl synthetase family protein [Micrococcales bacterium]
MPRAELPKQLRKVADRELLKNLEAGLERVEAALEKAVTHTDPIANVSTRHLTSAGGKRIRPTLVLLTAQLGNASADEVIDAAVVCEITHLATLYHDDVMDDAPMRRGVKTAHEIWGNNVAILTGDLLFARASQIVSKLGERALTLQADTFERLCLGQLHEFVGPQANDDKVNHYIQVLADKTGSLIAAAAQMGLMFSDADQSFLEPLRIYGEKIGVAFQLIDDVIDIHSDEKTSGKTPGTDLLAGVQTYPTLLLRSRTDEASIKLMARIDEVTEATLAGVVSELRDHEVTHATESEAKRWASEAVAALAELPDSNVKTALINFADAVVEREQ